VNLVYDIYFVFTGLGRKPDLVRQVSDILHGIVAGSIQLVDIHRTSVVERNAGYASIAGFPVFPRGFAVDRFGEDARTSRFSYSPRPAKQEGVGQLIVSDSVFQGGRNMGLTHNR
jgi:hypothetical protein